jgi:IPT/TIG domain
MANPPQPPPGHMVLFDDIVPPLEDNLYRITAETDVTIDGSPAPVDPNANPLTKQSFFSIEGPRFQLAQTEVVGVFPPRNGHGSFSENVPHLVLSRRTLPWERVLDPAKKFPAVMPQAGDAPAPTAPPPWLALLVFEDGDNFKIVQNMPLQQIVGPQIFQDLGNPPNVNCDALVTDVLTLQSVLPTVEELTLLAHVRQVNVNDRELNIGSTDGFFAVVMSNRLPSPNSNCTACLVSLEARSDLYLNFAPRAESKAVEVLPAAQQAVSFPSPVKFPSPILIGGVGQIGYINPIVYEIQSVQLVLLQSWKFSATGTGSFRDLMQEVNVAMFGTVANPGHPPLTDSGHIPMDLQDRAGEPERVFFRGPLTPFQLTRDPLGPYHSADQCVRATPETGGKDISYAAAFEVGRLLATSDKSLAAALMQWRRTAYSQASRADTLGRAQTALGIAPIDIHNPTQPFLASGAAALATHGAGPIADPFGLDTVQTVVGFNPTAVQQAFNLASTQEAIAILGGNAGATGATVSPIVQTTRIATTIDEVAADATTLSRLTQVRNQGLANTAVQLGMPIVNSIAPNSGPSAGGTTVTVTGAHFTGASSVNFGPAAGANLKVISDTQLTVVSPSQNVVGQNTADVRVITLAGESAVTPADVFTYVPPPQVTGISPKAGSLGGGTTVTVTGSGFTGATAVNFGPVAGTSIKILSDTRLTVVSPPVSPTGLTTVDVTIVTPSGTSPTGAADQFIYVQPPTVSAIKPAFGPVAGGAEISIIGSGFLTATGVNFGSVAAEKFSSNGDQLLIAVSPANKSGTQVDITVTNPAGTSAAVVADKYTYVGQPSVGVVVPGSGSSAGGAVVAIIGSGFTMASVMFGSAPARIINVADGEITVVTPPGQGVVVVTVTNPIGTSAATLLSRYTYSMSPPVVAGVNPNFLNAGQTTTISGSGFSGTTSVKFGAVPAASFTVVSDSQINVVIPQGNGTVNVTVTTSAGTSAISAAGQFTYSFLM